jgi:PD-(D/E)XK nuclease superfamily
VLIAWRRAGGPLSPMVARPGAPDGALRAPGPPVEPIPGAHFERSRGTLVELRDRRCCYAWIVPESINEFSWSRSRDNVFQECRRRYYYQYYGAWGGWEVGADPLTRRLYVLKQLGTRHMWVGKLVHEAIERALLAMRDGFALSEASLIEDTIRQMRAEWKGSRQGVYRDNPKRPGLFEHEYAVPVRDAEWRALRDHVVRCLRSFHRLPLLADIKKTPTDRWVLIEDVESFSFESTLVRAAPDFGYWTVDGRLQLIDWKTGSNGGGGDAALQLAGYALYAREVLRVEPPRVELLEVNLREGQVSVHPWDARSLERVQDNIRLSVRAMKAYLRDAARNLAAEADFEKTEDLRICRWCNFRAVCRPELPGFAAASGPSEVVAVADRTSPTRASIGAGRGPSRPSPDELP